MIHFLFPYWSLKKICKIYIKKELVRMGLFIITKWIIIVRFFINNSLNPFKQMHKKRGVEEWISNIPNICDSTYDNHFFNSITRTCWSVVPITSNACVFPLGAQSSLPAGNSFSVILPSGEVNLPFQASKKYAR